MPDLPPFWDEYLRLQTQMSRTSTIKSNSWGLEEEMNLFLENPEGYTSADARRLERAREAAARRERSRAQLRVAHAPELVPKSTDIDRQLDAKTSLRLIKSSVSRVDWKILLRVGQEFTQAEIARQQGATPGNIRAIVFRRRVQFQHLRPVA